jgi:hypothetical protein
VTWLSDVGTSQEPEAERQQKMEAFASYQAQQDTQEGRAFFIASIVARLVSSGWCSCSQNRVTVSWS